METNFGEEDGQYSALYGNAIIQSIRPGSVYFCGMNPGQFVMAMLEKAKMNGEPFFVVAQDALAEARYFDYVRKSYGEKLGLPTAEESQRCCDEYYADIQKRKVENRLPVWENPTLIGTNGKSRPNQVVVMRLNGLLARMIFDKNPSKQFYIKVSFPLDWMYPHLEPHNLILKINREPLSKLSPEIIRQDRDYWTGIVSPMIGDWLIDETSIQDVSAFALKVYLRHDFKGFGGDSNFVLNEYWHRKFSNNRSAIAGLYAWRAQQTLDAADKERMNNAADFACRRAWALCPYATSTVTRYVNFLVADKRIPDAIIVAETASKFRSQLVANQSEVLANQYDQMVVNLKGLAKKQ